MDDFAASFPSRVRRLIVGPPKDPRTKSLFHQLSLVAFFAWVGLGADGLSSSCYGPEEAYLALGGHPHLALLIALAIGITVTIIAASYSQIVELFPHGGGGYTVATNLLSPTAGMISGSALLIDYVLTITISVASGSDALFSFLPYEWLSWKVAFATAVIILLTLLNLRGIKESVVPLVPIFVLFILTHAIVIMVALMPHLWDMPELIAQSAQEVSRSHMELGSWGLLILLLRSYCLGAGTYTGIEAVSNSMRILREPKVETAKRTMRYMAISLAVTAMGLMLAYVLIGVHHEQGKTLNATLVAHLVQSWGAWASPFLLVTLFSEAVILMVAAQTGFLDGSNVLANMAAGRWLPARFSSLSDRFVTQNGVLIMAGAAVATLWASRGSVRFLVVLYSINVFITFTLSQLGMVRHWLRERRAGRPWLHRMAVSGTGLILTSLILCLVVVLKFHDGGWMTLLITGSLVALAWSIRRHYRLVEAMVGDLEGLTEVVRRELEQAKERGRIHHQLPQPTHGKTAVLWVSGFNGLGLHTLFTIQRTFRKTFTHFIFVKVGVIDSQAFKSSEDIHELDNSIQLELANYVRFMELHNVSADSVSLLGTEVDEEVVRESVKIFKEHPGAIFFGGQIVFPRDMLFSSWLHNFTLFSIQKKLYYHGVPVVVLPIRLRP